MTGRELLIGVSGGIAAYKTATLVSRLTQAGAGVTVVMTRSAARLVGPRTFESLSGRPVLTNVFGRGVHPHIEMASRAELLCIAPATANILAKTACGLADDLLSTLYLAFDGPVLMAPAMNAKMWAKAAVQRNVARLRADGVAMVGPRRRPPQLRRHRSGTHGRTGNDFPGNCKVGGRRLALINYEPGGCGGSRRLSITHTDHQPSMSRILITSGPTREHLDPVRYLTNASSGRMGAALAAAVVEAGHQAVIVSGPVEVEYPRAAEVHHIVSTQQLLDECERLFPACDGLIAAAAPCDYRPPSVAAHKLHKSGRPLRLELIETPDVAAALTANKKDSQWIVAFALETEDQLKSAAEKMRRKGCDMIVVNGPEVVRSNETTVELLAPGGVSLGRFSGGKPDVAKEILIVIEQRLIR